MGLVGIHSIVVERGLPSFTPFFILILFFIAVSTASSVVLSSLCNKRVQHGATQYSTIIVNLFLTVDDIETPTRWVQT